MYTMLNAGILLSTGYMRARLGMSLTTDDAELDDELAGLGGIWSLAYVTPERVVAANSFAGVEGWFSSSGNEGEVWLGSRALLVHLAAQRTAMPRFDYVALAGMLNAGYMVTGRTPYEGTTYTGAGTIWSVVMNMDGSAPRITIRRRRRMERTPGLAASSTAVAEALRAAASELSGDGQIRVGLTGGRDSRLIVAALLAAGNEITTFTRGPEESAEVAVARRVADVLGVQHDRVSTSDPTGEGFEVDPRLRIRNAIVLCDGQISAFDATGGAGTDFARDKLALSGSGGEVLRGGYAKIQFSSRNPLAGLRWLRDKALFPAIHLLDPDLVRAYKSDVEHWVDAVKINPIEGLFEYYLEQRTARWFGASRMGTALAATPRTLFLDDFVLTACFAAPLDELATERIIKEAMVILQPRLADVPFVGKRLVYDKTPPKDPQAFQRWAQSAPIPFAKAGTAGFDWRLHYGPEVALILEEAVAAAMLDGFFSPDRPQVAPPNGAADAMIARRAWHAATLASLTQPGYYDRHQRYVHEGQPLFIVPRPPEGAATSRPSVWSIFRLQLRRAGDLLRYRLYRRGSAQ